jgi:phosphohistidine phosphatase
MWTIPKGIVEPGLSAKKSAAKEAMEEAGIAGAVAGKSVGKYRYSKWGGTCEVEVFPMRVKVVKDRWPEKAFRKRVWLRPGAAARKLRHRKLARLVKSLEEWIESVDWE